MIKVDRNMVSIMVERQNNLKKQGKIRDFEARKPLRGDYHLCKIITLIFLYYQPKRVRKLWKCTGIKSSPLEFIHDGSLN